MGIKYVIIPNLKYLTLLLIRIASTISNTTIGIENLKKKPFSIAS